MRTSSLFLLVLMVACQKKKQPDQAAAHAVHDLLIDRVFWKPVRVGGQSGRLVNQHQFAITNTSSEHGYSQISIRFDYYDSTYHRVDSATYVFAQRIEPRSTVRIGAIQPGVTNPATKSATVTVARAAIDD